MPTGSLTRPNYQWCRSSLGDGVIATQSERRRRPWPQLVGTPTPAALAALRDHGIGQLCAIDAGMIQDEVPHRRVARQPAGEPPSGVSHSHGPLNRRSPTVFRQQ